MESIKKFISNYYQIILAILVGLSILYFSPPIIGTMSDVDRAKLDSLTNIVNQMNKEQDILENKVEGINKEVMKIDENISNLGMPSFKGSIQVSFGVFSKSKGVYFDHLLK
jgi:outer membrane murein-binding lipoprotein Lpp